MLNKYNYIVFFVLVLIIVTFFLSIKLGSVAISLEEIFSPNATQQIILTHRFHQSCTAILAGIALPVSGMLLQEYFKNVLAGPSVMGISSAAGLGIAVIIFLGVPSVFVGSYVWESLPIVTAGLLGALGCLLILVAISRKLLDGSHFIIIGFLISAFASALISILQLYSDNNELKQYVIWTFGSFSGLTAMQLSIFVAFVLIGLFFAFLALRLLQGNILGEGYAQSVGVNLSKMKLWVLVSSSILTGVTTSFLGPIAFVGIIVPFFSRMLYENSNLLKQFILNICIGIFLLLFINVLTENLKLPVNIFTSLIGIPMIVFILLRSKRYA